jgi:hypothetical protein
MNREIMKLSKDTLKDNILSNSIYAVYGAVIGLMLSLATTTVINEKNELKFNFPSLCVTIVTGGITGFLIALIQAYDQQLKNYKEKLETAIESMEACNSLNLETLQNGQNSYQRKIENLNALINTHESKMIEIYDLLERAKCSLDNYNTIQNILGSDKIERDLIKSFLDRVINQPDYITRSSIIDFYKLLILGLQKCTIWRGIHQGSIQNLGFLRLDDDGESYFTILRNNKIRDKKRIIILTPEEQQDLKSKDIMQAFWDKTGEDVPSYWISQENFYNFTNLPRNIEVHDCALHNNKVLLHYHRNYHKIPNSNVPDGLIMIDFAGSRSAIWKAVTSIFAELENPTGAIPFTKITKEYIDNLPTN